MRRGTMLSRLAFLPVLLLAASSYALSPNPSGVPSIILLDVSGSMERDGAVRYARYSSGQISAMMRQLAHAIAAGDSHSAIYVQPFSSSHEQYSRQGPLSADQVEGATPTTAGGRETELDAGLNLGLRGGADSYIFILTDNKNDFAGNRNDRQFYELLAKSPAIHTVYFVPLAQPDSKDALVLYAVACGSAHRSVLRQVALDFARAVGSEPVQFRGFYDQNEQESLSFEPQVASLDEGGEESPLSTEGDSIVLSYDEGRPVEGALKFRIHSRLNHWRIVNGRLGKLDARVDVPGGYDSAGEYTLPIAGSAGRKINVAPDGDSAEVYTLPLSRISDAGVSLGRSSLFTTHLPDIPAQIHLSAIVSLSPKPSESSMRPEFSTAMQQRIGAVRNLPEIMNLMTFQPDLAGSSDGTQREIPINRAILIRVRPNPLKNLLADAIEFGLPAMVLAALAVFLLLSRGKLYTLLEPGQRPRTVRLSRINSKVALFWDGRPAGAIQLAGNGFLVRPETGYSVDKAAIPGAPCQFTIKKMKSGDNRIYQVQPGTAHQPGIARKGFL